MSITLRDASGPLTLRPSVTPEEADEMAMLAEQDQLAGMGGVGRAIARGTTGLGSRLSNFAGQVVEPFSEEAAQPMFDKGVELQREARSYRMPGDVTEVDQVTGIGSGLNYVGNMVMEQVPQIPLTMAGVAAARFGLRNAAMPGMVKNLLGTLPAGVPLAMGETVGEMRQDPSIMANTTPLERLGKSAAVAVPQAALDGVGDALLLNRLGGAGKALSNVFQDGVGKATKDAAKHVAMAIPEAAITEGLPEVGQQAMQQGLLTHLNPNRDDSGDAKALKESFFGGWAGGSGMSVAGRGADVAWAQGRGATESIRNLLSAKVLPDNLKQSDDQSILNWDAEDDANRNKLASDLADKITNSEASQAMKAAASSFYERASQGARDAWTSVSDALGAEQKINRAKGNLDHFLNSARKATQDTSGKADAEASPFEQALYENFTGYLDRNSVSARDTEAKSRMFNTVKSSLLDDSWSELPWHALEDEFGTIGRATEAVVKLRENLVRAGQLEHDDEFAKLLESSSTYGQTAEKAMMEVVGRYGQEYITRKPDDAELRETVRAIRSMLQTQSELKPAQKAAFTAEMRKAFGANTEKVIQALSPKNTDEGAMETEVEGADDATGGSFQTKSSEEFVPGSRYVGSRVKSAGKQINENDAGKNLVADHGGFWDLGHKDDTKRGEINTRFNAAAADLRRQGNYVRALTPLEYAAEAGVSLSKIARHLKTTEEGLKDHPARMLSVDQTDMDKDKVSLDKDDLTRLAERTARSLSTVDESMPIKDVEQQRKIAVALGKKGGEQRKAMKELGLEHGIGMRMSGGKAYLTNNLKHGGNGVFTVHMADGSKHNVSAQHMISTMRERGRGQFSSRSAVSMFNSGIAALMNIDGVSKVTVNNVWGKEEASPFEMKRSKSGKAVNYFQIEPGLTLGDAVKAAQRGKSKPSRLEELENQWLSINGQMDELAQQDSPEADAEYRELEGRLAEVNDEIDIELGKQDTYEGNGEREAVAGTRGATDDNVTPTEHNQEPVQDFNDDGTPKHPYEGARVRTDAERRKLSTKEQESREKGSVSQWWNAALNLREYDAKAEGSVGQAAPSGNLSANFNGVTLRLRPGVSGKHITEGARQVIAVAKRLLKIKDSPTFTSSRMDMAIDLAGRSAAAQKAGDIAARDAAVYAAADAIEKAVLDEIEIAHALEDQKTVNRLTDLAASVKSLQVKYRPEEHDALLNKYAPPKVYKPKREKAEGKRLEGDRWTHHQRFLATLADKTTDEIIADGIYRKSRLESLDAVPVKSENLNQLIELMSDEQSLARDEIKRRRGEAPAAAEANAAVAPAQTGAATPAPKKEYSEGAKAAFEKLKAAREARSNEAAAPVEKALDAAEAEAPSNIKALVQAVRQALRTLKEAWVNGELDKAELVKNLRAAVSALRAVAGDAASTVRKAVQQFVKAYHDAAKNFDSQAAFDKVADVAKKLTKDAVVLAEKVLQSGSNYYTNMFGAKPEESVAGKEESATRTKLAQRYAKKFKGQFVTGNESKKHESGLSSLGPYRTFMSSTDGNMWFTAVPESLLDKLAAKYTAGNPEQHNVFKEHLVKSFESDAMMTLDIAPFVSSYDLSTKYLMVASALVGSQAETFMSEKGVLGKTKGASGNTWNVLEGLGDAGLKNLMGEFFARIQTNLGKENLEMNWHRDTGGKAKTGDGKANDIKFNAEASAPTGQGVTKAEFDAAKDYIAKVLGPKVKVSLEKTLGGNSAAWNRVNGEAIIRIAATSSNPMSKAHHEAMHEFFQRLMDAHPEAAEVLRTAANSPAVKRQIEQFFHNDANYAKIKAAIANDEHERVAYMFQLWAAGKLKLGSKTQSWFQKVQNFFREALGLLSNDQRAEAIMESFHDGKMSEPNAVASVLANDPKYMRGLVGKTSEMATPIATRAKELLYTAQNALIESGNKGFEKIGRMFSNETGSRGQELSFMDAKTMKTNQMNDRLWSIMQNRDEADLTAALEGLQTGVTSKDPEIAKLQERVRKFLDQMYDYGIAAGVDIRKTKNYFPRVWDAAAIAENKKEFIDLMMADHLKTGKGPLDAAVAISIVDNLVQNRGHEPVNEDELSNGFSPFMAASNKRVLDFIKDPAFAKFQEKSIETIMTTYVAQLVHKAEYTRRFGPNGSELRKMVLDAIGEEVGPEWAKARTLAEQKLKDMRDSLKSSGKTPAEISKAVAEKGYRYGDTLPSHVFAELKGKDSIDKYNQFSPELNRYVRAIMAMEGTLGADIDPAFRKWSSALIVYENMRLLSMSLFSQVIDPLGVMVRGGTVNDAWNTFKSGIAGTINGWRGKTSEDSATRLAMQLGIIDAGGYLNSQGNAYSGLYMGKTAQKWNDRLFRWNGVEGFSQGTRVGAMNAAIGFIKHHSTLPDEHSERWLSELNLKASDITLVGGELDFTNPKIQQAVFRWVEGAILRPNASMRPSWSSDPHFALIFHLKQFTYAMQKVLLERVFNEAKNGNLDPGITMVLTYVPTMIAADFLRGLAANGGEEPAWKRHWTFGDHITHGVQRAGLLGVSQIGVDVAEWGPTELIGPAGEQAAKIIKTFNKEIQRDLRYDDIAKETQRLSDMSKAEDFSGVGSAAKKTLRDALPINSLSKRYVYDEIVNSMD